MKRCLLVVTSVLLLAATPLRAEVSSDAVRQLTELTPLRGSAVTQAAIEDRVVVVTFFASWCPPCHAEFRQLKEFKATFGDRVTVVAINYFEDFGGLSSPKNLDAFLNRHSPNFHVVKGGRKIAQAFDEIDRIPSVFVFDRKGRLAWRFRHARGASKTHVEKAELEKVIKGLL